MAIDYENRETAWADTAGERMHVIQTSAEWGSNYQARRFFRWSGTPPGPVAPSAGGDVDGVSRADTTGETGAHDGYYALPGFFAKVEAGGSFSAGANLATDVNGRAVAAGGNTVVMRALEASAGAGNVIWGVFTSGR